MRLIHKVKNELRPRGVREHGNSLESPLEKIATGIMKYNGEVPTSNGIPVVPQFFDSLQSCIVSPDHLLTALVRDAINLSYHTLGSKELRRGVEAFMLAHLNACDMTRQSKLFHPTKNVLHGMNMSSLYEINCIAVSSFRNAIVAVNNSRKNRNLALFQIPTGFYEALSILESITDLVSFLWSLPLSSNPRNLKNAVEKSSQLVEIYLEKVRTICTLTHRSAATSSFSSVSLNSRKRKVPKTNSLQSAAIRFIDKPNVHRLRELVYSTLRKFGSLHACSELQLERTHQNLKRAISKGDNKDVHLRAMRDCIIDDWQARCHMALVKYDIDKDIGSESFARLVGGEAYNNSWL